MALLAHRITRPSHREPRLNDKLSPGAALRRSWPLTWTRSGIPRLLALTLPLAALTAALLRLVTQVALPLRPLTRTLVDQTTGNDFAAYYVGILAPVIVGILTTATVTLPLACTAFATLYDRLGPASARDAATRAAQKAA